MIGGHADLHADGTRDDDPAREPTGLALAKRENVGGLRGVEAIAAIVPGSDGSRAIDESSTAEADRPCGDSCGGAVLQCCDHEKGLIRKETPRSGLDLAALSCSHAEERRWSQDEVRGIR